MRSENSFLEAVGGRNAANQKLMVVDQATGEISFVKKSLEGINKNFTDQDVIVTNALKNLLGDNLGNYAGYTKSGNSGVLEKFKLDLIRIIDEKVGVVNTRVTTERTHKYDAIKSLEGSIDGKIGNGEIIYLQSRSGKGGILQNQCGWPGGNNCNARWGTGNDGQVPTKSDDPKATGHFIRRV